MKSIPVCTTAEPDLDLVVETLCRAFGDDPVVRWAIPYDAPDRRRWLGRFFEITTQMMLDLGGRVAHTPDHEGVLVWSGVLDTAAPPDEDDDSLEVLEQECGPCGPRVATLMRMLDDHHPAGLPPHAHGLFFAIQPGERTLEVAYSLLCGAVDWLRDREVGWYAEASSPMALEMWQMFGCHRVGEPIVLPEDGPPLFPIFWPASNVGAVFEQTAAAR